MRNNSIVNFNDTAQNGNLENTNTSFYRTQQKFTNDSKGLTDEENIIVKSKRLNVTQRVKEEDLLYLKERMNFIQKEKRNQMNFQQKLERAKREKTDHDDFRIQMDILNNDQRLKQFQFEPNNKQMVFHNKYIQPVSHLQTFLDVKELLIQVNPIYVSQNIDEDKMKQLFDLIILKGNDDAQNVEKMDQYQKDQALLINDIPYQFSPKKLHRIQEKCTQLAFSQSVSPMKKRNTIHRLKSKQFEDNSGMLEQEGEGLQMLIEKFQINDSFTDEAYHPEQHCNNHDTKVFQTVLTEHIEKVKKRDLENKKIQENIIGQPKDSSSMKQDDIKQKLSGIRDVFKNYSEKQVIDYQVKSDAVLQLARKSCFQIFDNRVNYNNVKNRNQQDFLFNIYIERYLQEQKQKETQKTETAHNQESDSDALSPMSSPKLMQTKRTASQDFQGVFPTFITSDPSSQYSIVDSDKKEIPQVKSLETNTFHQSPWSKETSVADEQNKNKKMHFKYNFKQRFQSKTNKYRSPIITTQNQVRLSNGNNIDLMLFQTSSKKLQKSSSLPSLEIPKQTIMVKKKMDQINKELQNLKKNITSDKKVLKSIDSYNSTYFENKIDLIEKTVTSINFSHIQKRNPMKYVTKRDIQKARKSVL